MITPEQSVVILLPSAILLGFVMAYVIFRGLQRLLRKEADDGSEYTEGQKESLEQEAEKK